MKDSKLIKERALYKLFVNECKNSTKKKDIKRRINNTIYVNNSYKQHNHFT